MRLDPEEQAIVVLEAIRTCMKESGVAHLPDVVGVCVVSGMTRPNAYNVIKRWDGQCWRTIGKSSIGLITASGRE